MPDWALGAGRSTERVRVGAGRAVDANFETWGGRRLALRAVDALWRESDSGEQIVKVIEGFSTLGFWQSVKRISVSSSFAPSHFLTSVDRTSSRLALPAAQFLQSDSIIEATMVE